MALLTGRSLGTQLLASSAAILALGCSFVLDTDALHKGGAGTNQTGMGGGAGAPIADAANDAPTCSFSERDPCSDCLGMNCCAETYACTLNGTCNVAFVRFQMCQKAAKKAANPLLAQTACTQAFATGGGAGATGLLACSRTNCAAECG